MDATPLTILRNWREQHKPPLSQSEAAARVGVSRAAWSRWEAGKRRLDDDLLPKVAKKTGLAKRDLRPDLVEMLS